MHVAENQPVNAVIDCGWGRLIFADTFASPEQLIAALRAESPGRRDIAFYVKDPHVLLAGAPHELFLDPSHAFRLKLSEYRPLERPRSRGGESHLCQSQDGYGAAAAFSERRRQPEHCGAGGRRCAIG